MSATSQGFGWTTCVLCGAIYQGSHSCPAFWQGPTTSTPNCTLWYQPAYGHACYTVTAAPLTQDRLREIIREEIKAALERHGK